MKALGRACVGVEDLAACLCQWWPRPALSSELARLKAKQTAEPVGGAATATTESSDDDSSSNDDESGPGDESKQNYDFTEGVLGY